MNALRRFILRSDDPAARWNFVAGVPSMTLRFDAAVRRALLSDELGNALREWADPFEALVWMSAYQLPDDARWVGHIAYDFARQIERLPRRKTEDAAFPTFEFSLCRAQAEPGRPRPERAADGPVLIACESHAPARVVDRSFTRDAYLSVVRRALDYIAAGDVFQLNLAQRLTIATSRSPLEVWHQLCEVSPASFGAMIEREGHAILCNSPELFFRIDSQSDGSRRIVNRPIKGTRPNAPGMFEELSRSAKDRAELAMIVDLQRNDLGRVCEIGSVCVTEARVIEATPTVYHGVATITGTLRSDSTFADVIRALFPCGSITGCPKIRAMELIDALEAVPRDIYCGAIGYLAADGSAEFNVAIRTIAMSDGLAHVYAGGGIVADSVPLAEYDETFVKASAMLAALGVRAGAAEET